ncbi:CHAP domain-containing protein [Acidipropionibacterium acidipropionici]|uniref:CHAP domain-containing protein n=1 Tax=Acidipropionibacterium acidipropionici TaxID=1748 RepID=UPI0004000385|nr:CHAP domain-containing protein [Acidipropionibacterium acidipropionici]ALN14513.1 hypothetical protein ASQ49_03620 [Acidipropionibacterium acidipropionici]APZ09728.1 CHAP domain-containing protein [Acidipropionibacterium acidipropionici]
MNKLPRIVGGSVVLAIVTTAAITGPAHAEDSSEAKLRSALAASQKSLATSKAQAATAQQNLTTSQARLASQQSVLKQAGADVAQARVRDQELGAKLATAQEKLKKADEAVASGKKQLASDRKRYATTMNRLVQQSSPLQSVSVFTTNMTTTDMNQRTQWSSVATNVSKDAVERISKQVTKLQADEKKQAAATKEAGEAKTASAAHLETTKSLESEAKSAADAVAATVALNKADAEEAQAKLSSDRAKIASLSKRVKAARQAAIEASNRLARQAAAAERRSAARSAGQSSSSTPGSYGAVANYNGVDPWGFYWGQCVSYAAWKVRSTTSWSSFENYTNGVHFGNAVNWGAAARQIGVTVNTRPAVGSVAWRTSGFAGHVAWVTGVHSDGTIDVSEYNYNVAGGFGTRSHVNWRSGGSSGFDGFIHF